MESIIQRHDLQDLEASTVTNVVWDRARQIVASHITTSEDGYILLRI